jgi:hypothetical protein
VGKWRTRGVDESSRGVTLCKRELSLIGRFLPRVRGNVSFLTYRFCRSTALQQGTFKFTEHVDEVIYSYILYSGMSSQCLPKRTKLRKVRVWGNLCLSLFRKHRGTFVQKVRRTTPHHETQSGSQYQNRRALTVPGALPSRAAIPYTSHKTHTAVVLLTLE